MDMRKIEKIVKYLEFKCSDNEMQSEEIKRIQQAISENNEIEVAISVGRLQIMVNLESSDFQKFEKVVEIEEILIAQKNEEINNQIKSFEDMDLSLKTYNLLKEKRIKKCFLTNLN